jgi:DNA-binding XRE family transcriptional regulator
MFNRRSFNALAAFRKESRLSQAQVARLLDDRERTIIAHYERGDYLPSLRHAAFLASLYGTSVEQLFPKLFLDMRTAARAKQERARALTRKHYDPPPNYISILCLCPGTRRLGVALFKASQTD